MSDSSGAGSSQIVVGSRVSTADSATGVVVEDFGDLAGEQVVIEPNRIAQSRRFAVSLDDGTIAFLDGHSLTVLD